MGLQSVPYALYRDVRQAAENIYRYDRLERFALNQILDAGRKARPLDAIVIKTAEKALKNHPRERHYQAA